MLTLDRKQQPIALQERRAANPLLLGGLLFAGLSVVPLSSDAPWDAVRVLGLLGLWVASGLLVALGLPRTRTRALPALASSGQQPVRLQLGGEALPPLYRAELVLSDGAHLVVLERAEPASVLEEAVELATRLSVPLVPGWGLDEQSLAALLHPPPMSALPWAEQPMSFESPEIAGRRNAAFVMLWASAFVLSTTILMSASARATIEPSALSVTLPIIGAVLVLIGSLWLLGLRGTLLLGPTGVLQKRSWFRTELGPSRSFEAEIRAAALVAPTGGPTGHLVVATTQGLRAFLVWGTTPHGELLHRAQAAAHTNRAAE